MTTGNLNSSTPGDQILNTATSDTGYDFLYWQCRIRQYSMRQGDGRPTPGMCPAVTLENGVDLGQIVTLMNKSSPEHITAQFKHMVKKTQDPIERWENAIRHLSERYYQDPKSFSDRLTALFGPDSLVCKKLLEATRCTLTFEHNRQRFCIPCEVVNLEENDPEFQATLWHNSMFNPSIPGNIRILAFIPRWSEAESESI